MKQIFFLLSFSSFFFSVLTILDINAQSCDCTEYIYLNEMSPGAGIHKYEVAADGSLIEVGGPWLSDLLVGDDFNAPHGLATDLNGFMYTSPTSFNDVRRLTCDGEIVPASEFQITFAGRVLNLGSIGNTLYMNETSNFNEIEAYDLCTGQLIGSICFNSSAEGIYDNWGFYIDPRTDEMYYSAIANGGGGYNILYRFTEADLNSGTCVDPFIEEIDGVVNSGDQELPANNIYGVTTDEDRNIYVVSSPWYGNPTTQLFKYSPNGNLLATSILDNDAEDGTAGTFSHGIAIVYSETSGLIYTSNGTESTIEDCVSIFDTDLNYIGQAVPVAPNTGLAKAMAIVKECCPITATLNIDTTICDSTYPVDIFLQDMFACEGIVCEGMWSPDPSNTGMTFNECNNSVTINEDACGVFTLSSDGSSANSQCGAFTVSVNIETASIVAATVTSDQTICINDTPNDLVATSSMSGVTYQWQMSTTSCADGFIDIVGETGSTYAPGPIFTTTYYQVVTSISGNCNGDVCSESSNCVTVTVDPLPTLATSTVCSADGSTYSVAFTSDGIVTADVGTVSGTEVTGIASGTDVTLTATLNGCTTEVIVTAPDCCPVDRCIPITITKS